MICKMPTIGVYAIYDKKSESYDVPFFCDSDLFAARHFKFLQDDKSTFVNKFPEDFNLVKIGTFDKNNGVMFQAIEVLITGIKGGNEL